MTLSRASLPAVRKAIRSYMSLADDDPVDVAVLSAIVANFAPDRQNPLWFVLVASMESGKSMLLDMILSDWEPAWPMPTTISPGYFFSGRTGRGALSRIDQANKRLLYMRDMGALVAIPQNVKQLIHSQVIGIYDGEYRHETGNTSELQMHKRAQSDRLGWIGAATEAFYAKFLRHTNALGSRFTPFYWQAQRKHWTDHTHLEAQREARTRSLGQQNRTRATVQAFLNEAIAEMPKRFPGVEIPRVQGQRIDAAVTLAMRVVGGDFAPPGGRTADRAAQFARTAAYLAGEREVGQEQADLGIRLVLSQMEPRYQRLIGYAVRPENVRRPWVFSDFLREVGGRRVTYSETRLGGPIENMVDAGILRIGKGGWGNNMKLQLTKDALRLVAAFDPKCAELRRVVMAEESDESAEASPEASDDNIGEVDLAALSTM